MSEEELGPLTVETTYPGQLKRTIAAPRHIVEHYARDPDSGLPFVEPVGHFKELLRQQKEASGRHREMLARDE